MAPSHSTPEQVSRVINNIIALLDSMDNKVLMAYHDYVAKSIRESGYDGTLNNQYALLHHIYAIKIVLQSERRTNAIATTVKDSYLRARTAGDTQQ